MLLAVSAYVRDERFRLPGGLLGMPLIPSSVKVVG